MRFTGFVTQRPRVQMHCGILRNRMVSVWQELLPKFVFFLEDVIYLLTNTVFTLRTRRSTYLLFSASLVSYLKVLTTWPLISEKSTRSVRRALSLVQLLKEFFVCVCPWICAVWVLMEYPICRPSRTALLLAGRNLIWKLENPWSICLNELTPSFQWFSLMKSGWCTIPPWCWEETT